MTKTFATAAILAALSIPAAAMADSVTLNAPAQGANLNGDTVDMSIYYLAGTDGAMSVNAVYVSDALPDQPHTLRMALQDGDNVTFALPGHPEALYNFQRADGVLTVTSSPVIKAPAAAS
ncbi:hypothetical protein [Paracoccus sp. (in: a-proteobacteria)]|uniref:hypothetical protein n=1 Tax=Paracoccus sp. TaxID=267 RepID=UPI003A886285